MRSIKFGKALYSDLVAVGAITGTSNVTTYVESAVSVLMDILVLTALSSLRSVCSI